MAYNFNGSNQSINTGFTPPVGANTRTLCAWFYCETFGDRKILDYGATTGNGTAVGITLEQVSSLPFVLFRHSGGNIRYAAKGLNVWQHVALVVPFDGATTNDVIVYVDGLAVAGTRNAGSNYTLATTSTNLFVGAMTTGASAFDGSVAEVGVWNVALTADEIASLGKGVTCNLMRPQSLVFYAPLIRNLQDVKSGSTLTNNNGAPVVAHPRVYK